MGVQLTVSVPLSNEGVGTNADIEAVERLAEELENDIEGTGDYVGHDIGHGRAVLFLLGDDADDLLRVVMEILADFDAPEGSFLVVEDGSPGDVGYRHERIALGPRPDRTPSRRELRGYWRQSVAYALPTLDPATARVGMLLVESGIMPAVTPREIGPLDRVPLALDAGGDTRAVLFATRSPAGESWGLVALYAAWPDGEWSSVEDHEVPLPETPFTRLQRGAGDALTGAFTPPGLDDAGLGRAAVAGAVDARVDRLVLTTAEREHRVPFDRTTGAFVMVPPRFDPATPPVLRALDARGTTIAQRNSW